MTPRLTRPLVSRIRSSLGPLDWDHPPRPPTPLSVDDVRPTLRTRYARDSGSSTNGDEALQVRRAGRGSCAGPPISRNAGLSRRAYPHGRGDHARCPGRRVGRPRPRLVLVRSLRRPSASWHDVTAPGSRRAHDGPGSTQSGVRDPGRGAGARAPALTTRRTATERLPLHYLWPMAPGAREVTLLIDRVSPHVPRAWGRRRNP